QLDTTQDGLLAVVVSTANATDAPAGNELAQAIANQLATSFAMPTLATPLWSQVITEKRATFSCTPDLQRIKEETVFPDLTLAGDYLQGPYPATIESAVRSRHHAASLLIKHFSAYPQEPGIARRSRYSYSRTRLSASSMRSTPITVNPSIFCLGAFDFGIKASEKPSLAASRKRSCPRGAGRIS